MAAVAQRAPDLQRRADHVIPAQRIRHGEVVHGVDDLTAVELEPVALIAKAEKYFDIGPAARCMERRVTVHSFLQSLHEFETRKLHRFPPVLFLESKRKPNSG